MRCNTYYYQSAFYYYHFRLIKKTFKNQHRRLNQLPRLDPRVLYPQNANRLIQTCCFLYVIRSQTRKKIQITARPLVNTLLSHGGRTTHIRRLYVLLSAGAHYTHLCHVEENAATVVVNTYSGRVNYYIRPALAIPVFFSFSRL